MAVPAAAGRVDWRLPQPPQPVQPPALSQGVLLRQPLAGSPQFRAGVMSRARGTLAVSAEGRAAATAAFASSRARPSSSSPSQLRTRTGGSEPGIVRRVYGNVLAARQARCCSPLFVSWAEILSPLTPLPVDSSLAIIAGKQR